MAEPTLPHSKEVTPPDTGAAVEFLVDHGLSVLLELVDRGKDDCFVESQRRKALARWLSIAPMLCTQARDAVARSPAYAAVIFYERTRLSASPGSDRPDPCFFNGLPRSMPMFGAPVAMQFPVDRMRDLNYMDVVRERLHTVTKLDAFARTSPKLAELAQQFDHLTDLSPAVPLRVRIFVSRTRSMCEGMRACKPAHLFRQCAHAQCNRLFMGNEEATGRDVCVGRATISEYWSAISPSPAYQTETCRFCSDACAQQWGEQLSGALNRTVDANGRGSYLTQLHGATTFDLGSNVSEPSAQYEFDIALKRNGQLKAAIGKLHKKRKKWAPAVARLDIDREVRTRVVRANVDLGVLHAALKAASIKRWRKQRRFPGDTWDWRERGSSDEVGTRARQVYEGFDQSGSPIDDMLKQHSFLNACKQSTRAILKIE